MDKIILDLCGGTGSWSKPYKDAGYDVRIITHPEYDLFEFFEYKKYIDRVYGILFAPTCTHFSLARTTAKSPRNLEGAMQLVNRGMTIIQDCRCNGNLKFWALENPMGYLRQLLGKPPFYFLSREKAEKNDTIKKLQYQYRKQRRMANAADYYSFAWAV